MSGSSTVFFTGEYPLKAVKLNTAFSERVLRVGDTMLGPLILAREAVQWNEAIYKQYVDQRVVDLSHMAMDDYAIPDTGQVLGTTSGYLPLTGGSLSGSLTLTAGDVVVLAGNVSSQNNVTATNAVLGGRVVAYATGLGFGGTVMSWDSSNATYAAGFRYNVNTGSIEFGPANAASGLTSVAATLRTDGLLTVNGNIVTANDGNISSDNSVTAKRSVIADHVLGFRSGTYGGAVGSWETGSGKGAGLRLNAPANTLEFGVLDPSTGNLTGVAMALTSVGTLFVNQVNTQAVTSTGEVSAGAGGVRYPHLSDLGGGGNHAIGFEWTEGVGLEVWVDGVHRGRLVPGAPRTEELEVRIAALEARIAKLEAAA